MSKRKTAAEGRETVTLTRRHRHAGAWHEAGAQLEVHARDAERLVKAGKARRAGTAPAAAADQSDSEGT